MQRIEEVYWLRAYGCLAVFFFHLLDHLEQHVDTLALNLARIPTVLGTPIFIFISIFLFSARYGRKIPAGFLGNRVKYVMLPYLVYGLAYSVAEIMRLRSLGFVRKVGSQATADARYAYHRLKATCQLFIAGGDAA